MLLFRRAARPGWRCGLALLTTVACRAELEVPGGTEVVCRGDGDCPDAYTCHPRLSRCIPVDSPDRSAPTLAASSVVPSRGAAGTVFVVTLEASEPLGAPPELSSADGLITPARQGDATAPYEYRYAASGTEPEGEAVLSAELIDLLGNAGQARVGSFVLDFTPPTALTPEWSLAPGRSVLRGGDVARAYVPVEPGVTLAAAVILDQGGQPVAPAITALEEATASTPRRLVLAVDAALLELTGLTAVMIDATLVDDVGNETAPGSVRTAPLPVDARAPETLIDAAPSAATFDVSAQLAFRSPDADVVSFECQIDGGPFLPCASPLVFARVSVAPHTFAVRALDAAGNVDATPAEHAWTVERGWRRFSAGRNHVCAIATDGTLWSWGDNEDGELGVGTSGEGSNVAAPTQVGGDDWLSVDTGLWHSCGVRGAGELGSLWCWGNNGNLEFGAGPGQVNAPMRVHASEDFRAVAVGSRYHTCAIRDEDGARRLYCVGQSAANGLGGAMTSVLTPVAADADGWLEIAADRYLSCGIRDTGTARALYCWGANNYGQVGNGGAPTDALVPTLVDGAHSYRTVSIGDGGEHACALRDDGDVVCWGRNSSGQVNGTPGAFVAAPVVVASTVTEIATGEQHTCVVHTNGEVQCWGDDYFGQFGDGRSGAAAGSGTWREGLSQLDAGRYFTCGLAADATLQCSGDNNWGQLGRGIKPEDPEGPTRLPDLRWARVDLGGGRGCGLRDAGAGLQLHCWGSAVASTIDGSLGCRGSPILVDAADDWLSLTNGGGHVCATRNAGGGLGTLWCWGQNGNGQLGLGSGAPGSVSTPTQVGASTDWLAVSAGGYHTCGIRDSGSARTLWCWGNNQAGRLGDDTETQRSDPTLVLGGYTDWVAVTAGQEHTCGLRDDGVNRTLWCWGNGTVGQLGIGPITAAMPSCVAGFTRFCRVPYAVGTETDWQSVAAGTLNTCGIRGADGVGATWCWGNQAQGQTGVGATSTTPASSPVRAEPGGASDWRALDFGYSHVCGLRGAGAQSSVWCWGDNGYSQVGADWASTPAVATPRRATPDGDWELMRAAQATTFAQGATSGAMMWGYGSLFYDDRVCVSAALEVPSP